MSFNDVNCKLGINYQLDTKWTCFCFVLACSVNSCAVALLRNLGTTWSKSQTLPGDVLTLGISTRQHSVSKRFEQRGKI